MQNINDITKLNASAKLLSELRPKFLEAIKKDSCDKHNMAFGGDDRFSVFSVKVFLDCHTGYYGNSSCSSMGSIDSAIAQRLLNKALNSMMPQVLEAMAKAAREEAATLTAAAQKEIDALQALINQASQSA